VCKVAKLSDEHCYPVGIGGEKLTSRDTPPRGGTSAYPHFHVVRTVNTPFKVELTGRVQQTSAVGFNIFILTNQDPAPRVTVHWTGHPSVASQGMGEKRPNYNRRVSKSETG